MQNAKSFTFASEQDATLATASFSEENAFHQRDAVMVWKLFHSIDLLSSGIHPLELILMMMMIMLRSQLSTVAGPGPGSAAPLPDLAPSIADPLIDCFPP